MPLFPPQYSRRDGRSPVLGLVPSGDSGRSFNFQTIDSAIGAIDAALDAAAGGAPALADGSITTPKLAPSATVPASVAVTATPRDILLTETLLAEWTVQVMAGRPILTLVSAQLQVTNTVGGINNPTATVLSLRQGGTAGGVNGGLVQATSPIVIALAQNASTTTFPQLVWFWPTGSAGPVRLSVTGIAPNADKNTVALKSLAGYSLTLA